jgi:hypothetical protein
VEIQTEGLGILNSADVVTMPKEEALEKFKEYDAARKRSNLAADKLMAQTFKALGEGRGVLNVTQAMKKAGVHEATQLPKLAIMRADQQFVHMKRGSSGACFFSFSERYYLQRRVKGQMSARLQFCMPEGTLPSLNSSHPRYMDAFYHVHSAPLPAIPPSLRPADALSKYCILWEVEKWEKREPPVDPMLLRPIGHTGLYVVVAHWDLTPVERMVLGALLGQ